MPSTGKHSLNVRHDASGISGNAFDFYVWTPDDEDAYNVGTAHVFTIRGNRSVGIGSKRPEFVEPSGRGLVIMNSTASGPAHLALRNTLGTDVSTAGLDFQLDSAQVAHINQRESNDIRVYTNGTERFTIAGDGGASFLGNLSASGDISAANLQVTSTIDTNGSLQVASDISCGGTVRTGGLQVFDSALFDPHGSYTGLQGLQRGVAYGGTYQNGSQTGQMQTGNNQMGIFGNTLSGQNAFGSATAQPNTLMSLTNLQIYDAPSLSEEYLTQGYNNAGAIGFGVRNFGFGQYNVLMGRIGGYQSSSFNGGLVFHTMRGGDLNFAMVIDNYTHVGINRPNPSYPLDVSGIIRTSNGSLQITEGTSTTRIRSGQKDQTATDNYTSYIITSGAGTHQFANDVLGKSNIASIGTIGVASTTNATGVNAAALMVSGGIAAVKSVYVGSNLTICGATTVAAVETGDVTVRGTFAGEGNVTSLGTIGVASTTEATGVDAAALMVSGGIAAVKSVYVGSNLTICGATTLAAVETGSVTVRGTLAGDSTLALTGPVSSLGAVGIASTTDATSVTAAALMVSGGIATAKTAYVGSNLRVIGKAIASAPTGTTQVFGLQVGQASGGTYLNAFDGGYNGQQVAGVFQNNDPSQNVLGSHGPRASEGQKQTTLQLQDCHSSSDGYKNAGSIGFGANNSFGKQNVLYGKISGVRNGNFAGGLVFHTLQTNSGYLRPVMVMTQNQQVGINRPDASYPLDVSGSIRTSNGRHYITEGATTMTMRAGQKEAAATDHYVTQDITSGAGTHQFADNLQTKSNFASAYCYVNGACNTYCNVGVANMLVHDTGSNAQISVKNSSGTAGTTAINFDTRLSGYWQSNTLVSSILRGTAPAAGRIECKGTTGNNYEQAEMNFQLSQDPASDGHGGLGTLTKVMRLTNTGVLSINSTLTSNAGLSFTGGHLATVQNVDGEPLGDDYEFMLLKSTGMPNSSAEPMNQQMMLRLTDCSHSAAVAGVYKNFTADSNDTVNNGSVLAIGEGSIWVCDEGGDIANGDFLVSSSVPGFAMRQSDALLQNQTVGKSQIDCQFEPETVTQQVPRKSVVVSTTEEQEVADEVVQRTVTRDVTISGGSYSVPVLSGGVETGEYETRVFDEVIRQETVTVSEVVPTLQQTDATVPVVNASGVFVRWETVRTPKMISVTVSNEVVDVDEDGDPVLEDITKTLQPLRQCAVTGSNYTAYTSSNLDVSSRLFTISHDFASTAPWLVGTTVTAARIGCTQHCG